VLTIHSLDCAVGDTEAVGGAADYVLARADRPAAFARGEYYAGDEALEGDAPAIWHGAPAALGQIGLSAGRAVERAELTAALVGQHVETRAQVRRPGNRTVERDGSIVVEQVVKSVDLTFSVPKSVSVAWSQAGPDERARIEEDVLEAARRTLDFMATQKACVHRRDPDGNRYREPAAGVAAALSLHVTARQAADDEAPAPQLHVHSVVVGLLRRDGALVTPDPWAWFRDNGAREGGALGRALLAQRLADRGYGIEPETGKKARYFELRGVPAAACEALSGRTREVLTRVAAMELAQGRKLRGGALAVVAKDTRAKKEKLDHVQVTSWWDAIAAEHGFGPQEAERLRTVGQRELPGDRAVAEAIMRHIAADGPTVTTVEARCIALEVSAGRTSPRRAIEILGELQTAGLVIALSDDRVTTKPIRQLEGDVIRIASRAAATSLALTPAAVDAGVAQAQASLGSDLDREQRSAVETICTGTAWANLVGRAGVGKGPVLEAVSAAHQAAGWQVLACAVDGTTAQRLGHQVNGTGYTIDGLATRIQHERLTVGSRTLIVVDEASKVDTARWADLAQLVDRGARLLAVGDEGQLPAIELPGLFSELSKRTPTIKLAEVRRHRDPEDRTRDHAWLSRYQGALHDGRGYDAIAILQENEALKLHETRADAMVALVEDWSGWRHEYESVETMLLVHGTNGDVDTVNELAQAQRLDAGEVGPRSVVAPDRDYRLHEGDTIVLRGAPIRLESGKRIENGTMMRVTAVDEQRDRLAVKFDRPGQGEDTATLDLRPLREAPAGPRRPALRLAYAMHPNPAQGATLARTAALGHPVADRNASYVADTRARYGHTIHLSREDLGVNGTDADRLDRHAAAISESRSRSASVAYRPDPARRLSSYRDPAR
jgi:conjugative relaxase-like TrwC/TraI family protein